jgi:hypothetical protein
MEILKYTEYKKQQALWLQVEDKKRTNKAVSTEQFCILSYVDYLKIIGPIKTEVADKIQDYFNKISELDIIEPWKYNLKKDEYITENINQFMDKIFD